MPFELGKDFFVSPMSSASNFFFLRRCVSLLDSWKDSQLILRFFSIRPPPPPFLNAHWMRPVFQKAIWEEKILLPLLPFFFFLARRGDSSNFIASSICMSNVLLHQQAALLRRPPSLASHCLTPALDPSPHYITPYRHCQLWEEEQLNPICLVSFFSFVCPYSNKVLNDNKSLGIQCTTSWYRLSPSHSALKSRFKKNSNHFLFIERDSANWFLWNFELSSRHVDASRTIVIDRKVEMDSSVSYFSLVGVNGMATTPVIKTRPLVRKEFIDEAQRRKKY